MRLIEEELNFNMDNDEAISHTGNTLFYLKRKNIQIQAWSPFLVGYFNGSIFDSSKYPNLNNKLNELANKYNVSKATIATKFLLMLDENLLVVTGSMDKEHIMESIIANSFEMEKKDWYSLYKSCGKMLP